MNLSQQILFLISAIGAFNGLMLSLYLFISKKGRSLPAFFLGVLLLVISVRIAQSVFLYFNPGIPRTIVWAGSVACFLVGPSLFFFLQSSLNNITQIPARWKWHWAILGSILLISFIVVPSEALCYNITAYIIYLQWLGYMVASAILLKPVSKALFVNAGLKTNEKLWLLVFLGISTVFLVYILSMANIVHGIEGICVSGAIVFSFFLYLTSFLYLHSGMESVLQVSKTAMPDKYEKKKIAETDAQVWVEKLERIILDKELYKDPNLKLNDLAQKINISSHLLSRLLNDNLGKSFSTYINEYRISEACRMITASNHLTFEAIGYEVGYNSKSTFYAAFKKIKDTTPALFKESLEK